MSAVPTEWANRIRSIHAKANGLLTLDVVRKCDVPGLVGAALAGDDQAARLLRAVTNCLGLIQDAPAHAPMQCGCCAKSLRQGRYAIVVAHPDTLDPADVLGLAICARCGPTLGEVKAAAVRALRLLWPDSRPITHVDGGRA